MYTYNKEIKLSKKIAFFYFILVLLVPTFRRVCFIRLWLKASLFMLLIFLELYWNLFLVWFLVFDNFEIGLLSVFYWYSDCQCQCLCQSQTLLQDVLFLLDLVDLDYKFHSDRGSQPQCDAAVCLLTAAVQCCYRCFLYKDNKFCLLR